MAASLESRVPYLDHLLVEQVMQIPGDQRMRRWQTKVILREALRKMVPPAIMNRSKMGFPVPSGVGCAAPFGRSSTSTSSAHAPWTVQLFDPGTVRRIVDEHVSGIRPHTDRLWLLVNLEMWQRIAIDGEMPQPLEEQMEAETVPA